MASEESFVSRTSRLLFCDEVSSVNGVHFCVLFLIESSLLAQSHANRSRTFSLLCHLHERFHLVCFWQFLLHHPCLQFPPPQSASPCQDVFQGFQNRIASCTTYLHHGSTWASGNDFRKEKKIELLPGHPHRSSRSCPESFPTSLLPFSCTLRFVRSSGLPILSSFSWCGATTTTSHIQSKMHCTLVSRLWYNSLYTSRPGFCISFASLHHALLALCILSFTLSCILPV